MKALEWFHIDSTRSFLSNWVEISSDLSEIPLSNSINSNENQIGAGRFPIFFKGKFGLFESVSIETASLKRFDFIWNTNRTI